jgi:hypothetical protein
MFPVGVRGLTLRRPLWDEAIAALLLGGLSVAVTGVVVAWRWLALKAGNRAGPRPRLRPEAPRAPLGTNASAPITFPL